MDKLKITPTGIQVNRDESFMTITWNDDHKSKYSFSLLRHACPCAECRGHENMGPLPDPGVFDRPSEDSPRTHLTDVEAVGSYAITIYWGDGHQYGIYNWNYLRALCPCDVCRGI
ncbi:MAG: DUF971 domain-containing protein [Anaerolineales bacterium]|nr:DUF971 domain-containing protein [Chloroflexota bacterium]MBL6980738.1 DUF971 domain-containing protein [Anaerolineales bacterium]